MMRMVDFFFFCVNFNVNIALDAIGLCLFHVNIQNLCPLSLVSEIIVD